MKPDAVNTAFVLDMQRKLHKWSVADTDKVFADLFNIVCDRRTLSESWLRLTRNKGSRTPSTDGVTRKTVEERPGGAAQFIEDIRGELRSGTYRPEPVRQRLIPKPGKPGKVRPLGSLPRSAATSRPGLANGRRNIQSFAPGSRKTSRRRSLITGCRFPITSI